MNCGDYATIINVKNNKVDIQFDDGNIIYDKYYGNFKKGQIGNYINHIGETKIMNCGLKATIISYKNYHNIDIQFEDNSIITKKCYNDFLKGTIAHNSIKTEPKNKIKENRIGQKQIMNCGMECEIIEYNNCDDITVKFEDGTIVKNKKYDKFKKGRIKNKNIKKDYSNKIGEKNYNKDGIEMIIIEFFNPKNITIKLKDDRIIYNKSYYDFKKGTIKICGKNKIGEKNINKYNEIYEIIDYKSYNNMTIKFDNGYEMKCISNSFKNAKCSSPYAKTVYEKGYIGEGIYNSKNNIKLYDTWSGMFTRCYNLKYQKEKPTYIGCEVCEEWLNLQNFGKWYDENYYELGSEQMHIDKDILIKNNKLYSPDTCIFVPNNINTLFTNCKTVRGEFPIGVSYNKQGLKHYKARISNNICEGKRYDIGNFYTPEEAFYAYKKEKERIIKQIADEYAQKYPNFPSKLYNAMYNYQVEITD